MAKSKKDRALLLARSIFPAPVWSEPHCYRIIRFRFKGKPRTVRNNVTEAEAQAHCGREDTHGPGWFDGYDYMRGCRPKDD